MNDIRKLLSGLRETSVVYEPNDDHPLWVITEESDVIFDLGQVITFAEKVLKGSEKSPVSLRHENVPSGVRRKVIKWNPLGDLFAQVMRIDFARFSQYYPCHDLHPYVAVVQSALEERFLLGCNARKLALNDSELIAWVDRVNGCFDDLKRRLQSSVLRSKTDNFSRNARKNSASLWKYFDAVMRILGFAEVRRAELFFRKGQYWPNGTDQVEVDYKTVRSQIKKLKEALDDLPENYLLGHALRLDNSLERGYVIHVILFINPHLVQQVPEGAITFLGKKWSENTANKGVFYEYGGDIPSPQSSYKRCGTGLRYADDLDHQSQLKDAAMFLSMMECLVQLKVPERDRVLWRGTIPKSDAKPRKVAGGTGLLPTELRASSSHFASLI